MAATNYTPIQLYYSTTASAAPTAGNLVNGELAINITDGKLYYKDNGGVVQVIATKGAGTIGGSNTQIQFNDGGALAGNAAMVFNKATNVTTLTTLNLTNALGATYGGTAQSAYAQGDLLYASAVNTLSKLSIGTVNYILTSTGSVPQWVAPTSVTVQTANNLAGGAAGSVPYQSAADTTTFLAIGAANRVMTSTGSAPQWVTSLTGLTGVSSSSMTNTGLTSGRVVYSGASGVQTDSSNLTFNGTTLSAGGFSTTGNSTLVKLVTIGDSSFTTGAVLAAATPAKLYIGTGAVTDGSSAGGATNTLGTITAFGQTQVIATNANVTYTNLATLYIAGAPTAGTNVTITNPYAFYVAGGASYFGGAVDFAVTPSYSGGTANGVMYLNGSKQITTGSALQFSGTYLQTLNGTGIQMQNSGATANWFFETSGLNLSFTSAQNGAAIWSINGSEQARLTSTGLGVGTNSPVDRLTIVKSTVDGASTATFINSGTPTTTTQSFRLRLGSFAGFIANPQLSPYVESLCTDVGNGYSALAFGTYGSSGVAERMRIAADGKVGIATSSPSAEGILTIGSSTSTDKNGIVMNRGASGSVSSIQVGLFNETNGIGTGESLTMRTPNGFKWQNNDGSAEWMRLVGTTGNLLLGTTTSLARLTVSGDAIFGQLSPATRYTSIGNTGIPTIRYDDNGIGQIILQNLGITGTDQGFRMSAQFSGDGTNTYLGGYIQFLTEGAYTGTASTRDSALTFATVTDGTQVEKLRITSAGRVGVNTQTPGSLLEVVGASLPDTTGSSGAWTLRLRDTTATAAAGTGASILLQGIKSTGGGVGNYAAIAGLKENGTSGNEDGYLGFYTVPNSTGLITERARITSTGNLLVDNAGPVSDANLKVQLNVTSSNTQRFFAVNNNGGYGLIMGFLYNDQANIRTVGAYPLVLGTNNGERLRITSAGYVGIGTSNPGTTLDVAAAYNPGIRVQQNYTFSGANYALSVSGDGATAGYLSQNPAAGGMVVADGMRYYGGGPWTPDSTSAESMQMLGGNIIFTSNTGLTGGVNFTPTERARLTAAGDWKVTGQVVLASEITVQSFNKSLTGGGATETVFTIAIGDIYGDGIYKFTVFAVDATYPNGNWIQEIYVTGSREGLGVVNTAITQQDKVLGNNGIAYPTWSISVSGNSYLVRATYSYGAASMYIKAEWSASVNNNTTIT